MTAICKHGITEVKLDFQAVKLDVTKLYNIEEEDKKHIEAIWDVFMYDKNTRTYCCEMTPSYFLIHLYTTVVFAGDDVDEDTRDRIDQRYAHESTDSCYMHCSTVDSMSCKDKTNYTKPFEDEENAREYMQGNCPF